MKRWHVLGRRGLGSFWEEGTLELGWEEGSSRSTEQKCSEGGRECWRLTEGSYGGGGEAGTELEGEDSR